MADIRGNESTIAKKRLRYELDWDRMIYVDNDIDDTLVRRLAPQIIRFKSESAEPITVAIDSEGGQVRSLESLLGLLESPDQRGGRCAFYTVAVNRAQSAAASLLAFGEYSVAFNHAQILFHPHWRRMSSGLSASEAIQMARDLKASDEILALRLAERVLQRKLLCFADLRARNRFSAAAESFPRVASEFRQKIGHGLSLLGCVDPDAFEVDFVGFATALWAELSAPLDRQLVTDALDDLVRLLEFRELGLHLREGAKAAGAKKAATDTSAHAKLARAFEFACMNIGGPEAVAGLAGDYISRRMAELERLVVVFLRRAASSERWRVSESGFSQLEEDYSLLEKFEEFQGNELAQETVWEHFGALLSSDAIDRYNEAEEEAKEHYRTAILYPQRDFFWLFHVMMCRRLGAGENTLSPTEAQLLGLVEEVLGGGAVTSRGERELMSVMKNAERDTAPGETSTVAEPTSPQEPETEEAASRPTTHGPKQAAKRRRNRSRH